MKNIIILAFLIFLNCNFIAVAQYTNTASNQLGWRLALQAYTFNRFTFEETIDKLKEAAITNVEMYSHQTIGGNIEGETTYLMKKETSEQLLKLLKSKNIRLVNYGVITPKTESDWIKLFDFAKEMGIETIISEADSLQLNIAEPLAEKYKIKIALHNHPKPSIYWNPDFTMLQLAKRSKYIGVCVDFGHWLRSGLNPLESLKKYEGRVISVHAKDIVPGENCYNGYHDVPWGTGLVNFSGLMHELKRQNFKGVLSVEYEYHWENSLPEIIESVQYFNRLATWMSKENSKHIED